VYRFLLSARWLGFAAVVTVLTVVSVQLGLWQWERLDDRAATNTVTEVNLAAPAVAWSDVMAPGQDPAEDDLWRRVQVSGSYDTSEQVTVKYRTRDGAPGVDVVTPLVTAKGTAVLVDRGWLATDNTSAAIDVPAPPSGEVTVTGWLQADSGADSGAVTPIDGQVRAISSDGFADAVPYPVAGGYLLLVDELPAPEIPLEAAPAPDLGQGPHFFYGLQWFFFAALAVVGYLWFAWLEVHPRGPRRTFSDEDEEDDMDGMDGPLPIAERTGAVPSGRG
jgi:cytochrome oxidase assembly protein ShyY1